MSTDRKTKATDAILKYVRDLNARTIAHDDSKFTALLKEYGEAAIDEWVDEHNKQNWQSIDTDEDV